MMLAGVCRNQKLSHRKARPRLKTVASELEDSSKLITGGISRRKFQNLNLEKRSETNLGKRAREQILSLHLSTGRD
ncbi:hypothetical protein DY000_02060062 [Brassica cretica]|uniref:Uncharacterized protein n=1 Tax=Brassica cretica TaxID=69181 RepID=A0ABQ7AUX8_BRACR|nr:hypothetical protein DY000_02060062 [Brassica cretica]